MTKPRLKIYFDGGARPNPGQIEAAVVLRGQAHIFANLGHGSNLDAEWLALIAALRLARSLPQVVSGELDFDLVGDAAHVIARASGTSPCRDAAQQAHLASFHRLAATTPPRRIRWISRRQNLAGIALLARHAR